MQRGCMQSPSVHVIYVVVIFFSYCVPLCRSVGARVWVKMIGHGGRAQSRRRMATLAQESANACILAYGRAQASNVELCTSHLQLCRQVSQWWVAFALPDVCKCTHVRLTVWRLRSVLVTPTLYLAIAWRCNDCGSARLKEHTSVTRCEAGHSIR
jgi:hypothetical protein